ncbi:hypothetical protein Q674_03785 [Acinetobacter sp. COS3]|nr:hypothetical protein Q674_03785 [Acinetobacter sp. COS3]
MMAMEVADRCRYGSGWLDEAVNQSTDHSPGNPTHPGRDRQRQAFGNAGTNPGTGH